MKPGPSVRFELDELRARLREAEETLEAIRSGGVDALVVSGPEGERIFTLSGAEHPYRLMVESMNEGALSLGSEGEILYANTAFARIVGLGLDRIIGSRFIDFATHDSREAMAELLLRGSALAIRGKLALIFGNSDAAVPVQLSLNPVKIDVGECISVVVTDLSDREREQQAREAIKVRDEFIALAAHELRNPVSTLSLTITMLERLMSNPDPDPAMLQRSVVRIGKQTRRVSELISRLLDVSKLANAKMTLELASHDLGQIVRELVEECREEALQSECAIETQIETGLTVRCDRLRLEQSVANVLSNAMKYGRGKPIFVRAQRDQTHAIVEVDDHGIGISEEDQERIFNRFERGAGTGGIGGLGLGLYISRQIVHQHGGSIFARSRPTGGSRFTITLPLDHLAVSQQV